MPSCPGACGHEQGAYETSGIPGGVYRDLSGTTNPVHARYIPGTNRYLGPAGHQGSGGGGAWPARAGIAGLQA